MASVGFMETYSGKRVDFLAPDPASIDINDIAHALAQLNRYTGHTKYPYSVAQHCVLMASYFAGMGASKMFQLCALLHDAQEAYIGDVSSPLKALLPNYKDIELVFESAIREKFNLSDDLALWEEVRWVDLRILATERIELLPNTGDHNWRLPETLMPLPVTIKNWSRITARNHFLDTYKRLTS